MSIVWEEKYDSTRKVRIVVDMRPFAGVFQDEERSLGPDMRPATPDDLRRACEAVGMVVRSEADVVGAQVERDEWAATLDNAQDALATEKAARAKAESLIAQVRDILRDTEGDEDIVETARRTAGAVDLVVRQRDDAMAERDALRAKLEKEEEERLSLLAEVKDLRIKLSCATERAEKAEQSEDANRARLAALTAPVEGEPTVDELSAKWYSYPRNGIAEFALIQWRAGYAACAAQRDAELDEARRASNALRTAVVAVATDPRHQPTEPRATEEELLRDAEKAMNNARGLANYVSKDAKLAAVRAIRDRVRAERPERPACLVERAVRTNVDIEIAEAADPRKRYIRVTPPCLKDDLARTVPNAEAAATLDAMLREVGA